jgi:hypothetical protein
MKRLLAKSGSVFYLGPILPFNSMFLGKLPSPSEHYFLIWIKILEYAMWGKRRHEVSDSTKTTTRGSPDQQRE